MKILMLSPEDISKEHGGAVHTREVALAFGLEGHEVVLISPGQKEESDSFKHISRRMRRRGVATTWEAAKLEGQMASEKFDLIYERQLIFGGLGSHWGRRWGTKVIFEINSPHMQEIKHRYKWMSFFSFFLIRREKKMFKGVTGVVTTHKDLVPEHYEGPTVIGPWAVSIKKDESEEEFEVPEGHKLILVAGSFQSWHGQSRLLPILKELGIGDWALALAGGDDEVRFATYEELSKHLDFPVLDLGRLKQSRLHSVCRGAHVLLAPFDLALPGQEFYYSPFKILEALAAGLPVVSNDYENIRILCEKEWCGQLIDSFEPAIWAQALKKILKARRASANLGEAYAAKHSWRNHVSHFLKELL
jgi:glycosyltransferase involved in cell wall biosynthesis